MIADEVIICADASGAGNYISANFSVFYDGIRMDTKATLREDNCYSLSIPLCIETVKIRAISGQNYKGETFCSGDPSPLVVAMEWQRGTIIATAFQNEDAATSQLFNATGLIEILENSDSVVLASAPEVRATENRFYAALSAQDYALAQREANEMASLLRQSGETGLSLAYSSLTYLAGFYAIGVEPLSPGNPMVSSIGSANDAYLVLTPEGQNVLSLYQAARALPEATGVWDFQTTRAVAAISDSRSVNVSESKPRVPTPGLLPGDLRINSRGGVLLP